jgi:hypothetical protein
LAAALRLSDGVVNALATSSTRSAATISTSDDLYSVFLADLSEAERERIRSYADDFGIEPTDAVWALMIVLGRYSDLYDADPGEINLTVQRILEKIQSVAAAEAESSRVRLQASLTDAVVGAAESVAARMGHRELVKCIRQSKPTYE